MKNKHFSGLRFSDLIVKDLPRFTIVNKPPFLSCLEDRSNPCNLLALAREVSPSYRVCHRIDKETSGLVVLAKDSEAYKSFSTQLENREVKKVYHAVVDGIGSPYNFEANEPLYTTSNRSGVDFKCGKPSLTLFQTLRVFKRHALLKCFPVSGRMHQIRVHLAFHGFPISHDLVYGGQLPLLSSWKKNYKHKKEAEERPVISRVALHAKEIAFKDTDGQIIVAEASYSKDIKSFLAKLEKYK